MDDLSQEARLLSETPNFKLMNALSREFPLEPETIVRLIGDYREAEEHLGVLVDAGLASTVSRSSFVGGLVGLPPKTCYVATRDGYRALDEHWLWLEEQERLRNSHLDGRFLILGLMEGGNRASIRYLEKSANMSSESVDYHVSMLEEEGFVEVRRTRSPIMNRFLRKVSITPEGRRALGQRR